MVILGRVVPDGTKPGPSSVFSFAANIPASGGAFKIEFESSDVRFSRRFKSVSELLESFRNEEGNFFSAFFNNRTIDPGSLDYIYTESEWQSATRPSSLAFPVIHRLFVKGPKRGLRASRAAARRADHAAGRGFDKWLDAVISDLDPERVLSLAVKKGDFTALEPGDVRKLIDSGEIDEVERRRGSFGRREKALCREARKLPEGFGKESR